MIKRQKTGPDGINRPAARREKGVRMTMHNLGEVRTALAAGELDEALARLMCGDPAPGRQRVTQLLDGFQRTFGAGGDTPVALCSAPGRTEICGNHTDHQHGRVLAAAVNPLYSFFMSLMLNARHLFYGISMLDKFRGTGWKKVYLIFGMCDESFSINYTADIPENVDRGWFMFFVTLLNHFYWFSGATLGGIFGSLIHFNTEGLDFVMTAMFVVIFMEQWLKEKNHTSSILGLGISLLCLIAFGADNFIIPAMLALLVVLTLMRRPLEKEGEVQ